MDEESMLQHHEALLVQELALVRAKLQFVRLSKSEQQKVHCSPSPSKEKEQSSPEQTAPGKDSSKPLMDGIFPKNVKELSSPLIQASSIIKNAINLRPNQGIQIPNKNSKPYYVVFNGPNRGIFENWDVAKQAVEGISNCKHKRFNNFLEAKTAANIYCRENELPELQLICSSDTLRPANFAAALKTKKDKKVSLGRLPSRHNFNLETKEENHLFELNKNGFDYLYQFARQADEEKLLSENFFTTDKKNLSYFNFIKGADPEQVSDCYSYGLVKYIYPSLNLKEISLLPKPIYKAIKTFRTKVLKSEKDIFLKISSSIPIWEEDQTVCYEPQHLIHIGVSSGEKCTPSKVVPCNLESVELFPLGLKKLEEHLNLIFQFSKDDHVFVNYEDRHCLVYSTCREALSKRDEEKILMYQQRYTQGTFMSHHDRRICSVVQKKIGPCSKCEKPDGSSTNEKDTSPTHNDKGGSNVA